MSNDPWRLIIGNEALAKRFGQTCREHNFPARTVLLGAGEVAQRLYIIKQGCIRLWFNHDGKDVTLQFFFEGQPVASIESFMRETPSLFSIETIEPTVVWECDKAEILRLADDSAELKDEFCKFIADRLINYTHLFLSRIKDSPQTRYARLLEEHPEIIKRIPQHYIASYLGITAVSLSRIRNRK